MIQICFPPGCYGSYMVRSIYNYTELNTGLTDNFDFGPDGSSHVVRTDKIRKKIYWGHLTYQDSKFELPNNTITILPDNNHNLDYFNNQFFKQGKRDLVSYIINHFSIENIQSKLSDYWNYKKPFDENVPKWILREFFSLCIVDIFADAYSFDTYNKVPAVLKINTQDIFTDYLTTIQTVSNALQLTLTEHNDTILKNHTKFLNAQRFHNSQLNCKKWVMNTLNGVENLVCPSQTIFDEAYIQYYFKLHGYEIQCDGLNDFSKTTTEMNKIIYKS